jgi:hypothetical protein
MVDFKALAAPFPPEEVSWRLGSVSKEKMRGMALAYLDARNVMDRLDAVCGPELWQATYPHANAKTVCSIGILCGDHWVWKTNGAGDSDIEAEKGAMSDAFKRAAVLWGVGRYLYMLESPWIEVEEIGKTGKFRIVRGAYKELDMILRRFNQALLNPPQPNGMSQAKDDIAGMQNRGEQPVTEMKTHSRQAAEKFYSETLEQWQGMNAVSLADWYREMYSKTKTNHEKVEELQEKHPDLYEKLQTTADEIRLRRAA